MGDATLGKTHGIVLVQPRVNLPDDASMSEILNNIKREIETVRNTNLTKSYVLYHTMIAYGMDFSDQQVDQIVRLFKESQRKQIIQDLNANGKWF
jgi:Tfp pilus assembly ATPase PilU